MFISFFESFKYMGHMWPIALLRIYFGIYFLQSGLMKVQSGYLKNPVLQNLLQKWLENGVRNTKYAQFLQNWVVGHWQVASYFLVIAEIAVGISFVIGFMVRPASLIAIFLSVNFILAGGPDVYFVNKVLIALNATFFLVAAGRCWGFDYYFYKRVRGFWW